MTTSEALIQQAKRYLGMTTGDERQKALIQAYNRVQPRPQGYCVKATDDWCDVFVTVMADQTHLAQTIGRECSVKRHVDWFKQQGIWRGRIHPEVGDIITFDWEGNGWPDHIGIVSGVTGERVDTIEGNTNGCVACRDYPLTSAVIYGYARPRYTRSPLNDIVSEVLQGKWGNGREREERLRAAGYDYAAVQAAVNHHLHAPKAFTISTQATHWATGETIAPWVKGKTFAIQQARHVGGETQYLITHHQVPLGWLSAQSGTVTA